MADLFKIVDESELPPARKPGGSGKPRATRSTRVLNRLARHRGKWALVGRFQTHKAAQAFRHRLSCAGRHRYGNGFVKTRVGENCEVYATILTDPKPRRWPTKARGNGKAPIEAELNWW